MIYQDKYNITQHSYPSDLLDPIYGGNMVVFYINVANASKFLPPANETYDMSQLNAMNTPRNRGLLVGRNVSEMNAILSSLTGTALEGIVGGSLAGVGGLATTGVAAQGVALKQAFDIAGTTTREQKRLKTAIALHMPNNLNIRYSVGWTDEETAAVEMASIVGEDAAGMAKSVADMNPATMVDNLKNYINSAEGQNASSNVKSIASAIGLKLAPPAASARTGLAANPRKEMVFKGVDFRTFTFDYQFFPRSEEEAENVARIIGAFKFHMHPEYKDTNSFLFLYPSEFDITYYTKDGENTHLHRHSSCVLTEMNVNYTPNGNFNVFSNGMPTQINISLSFKELSIPTKESVEKGL